MSAFLALPPELRVRIYGYCFDERVYHIEAWNVTASPTFAALRQVSRLIKHEFDPLYERASRQNIDRFELSLTDFDDPCGFTDLMESLPGRNENRKVSISITLRLGSADTDGSGDELAEWFHLATRIR